MGISEQVLVLNTMCVRIRTDWFLYLLLKTYHIFIEIYLEPIK